MSVAYPAACPMCAAPNPGTETHFINEHGLTIPEAYGLASEAERIRELEAELSLLRKASGKTPWGDLQFQTEERRARAERAEAALVEGVRESNKKYQARVKDLEAQLELLKEQKGIGDIKTELRIAVTRAENLQAYNVDLKDRLETGSRWLKAEIAGRETAEKDRDDWRRKFDALVAVAVVPEGTLVPFVQELSRKQEKNVGPKR